MCHIVSLTTNFLYIDIHIIIWHLISKDLDTLLHLIEHTALYYLYVVVINVIKYNKISTSNKSSLDIISQLHRG